MEERNDPTTVADQLTRLERKVTLTMWLAGAALAVPLLQSAFGLVRWSAVILFVLIVGAVVLALFRDKLPQLLRRGGRWAVNQALADPEPERRSAG